VGTLAQYEVVEVVGRGGMGIVLRAFDTKLNRVVAIKAMALELAANPMAVKRFLREARAAAAISHDHVVTIHAIDEDNRPPFIVMEFVDGQSLQEKIDRIGPLELKETLRIGMQMARGLAAAHEQGLVHRDIKPANILLENGVERVKITDFGLARAVDDVSVTQTGQIAGTPQFMSPEQAQGHTLDARSDLFSLGSVLYTMCAGRPPFRAETAVAMLRRVTDDEPRSICEVNSETPDWLEVIILKLLAKDPAERFQSAAEVAELLSRHLAHLQHPTTASQPKPTIPPKRSEIPHGKPVSRFETSHRRREFVKLSAYVAAVLLLLGLSLAAAAIYVAVRVTMRPSISSDHVDTAGSESIPSGVEVRRSVEPVRVIPHDASISSLAYLPDGTIVTSARDASSNEWKLYFSDVTEIRARNGLSATVKGVSHLVASADGKWIAAGSREDHKVVLWDATRRQPIQTFETGGMVHSVSISPDGKLLAAASWDGSAKVWDVESHELVKVLGGYGRVHRVLFSPDGKALAVSESPSGRTDLYETETWSKRAGFKHDFAVGQMVFSPDSKLMATGGNGQKGSEPWKMWVKVWNASSGKMLMQFKEMENAVEAVAISPDSRYLIAVGGNWRDDPDEERHQAEPIRIWNLTTRQLVAEFDGHDSWVRAVVFAPSGKHFATTSREVKVWNLDEIVGSRDSLNKTNPLGMNLSTIDEGTNQ
jgi:serine/threonine protein kinase